MSETLRANALGVPARASESSLASLQVIVIWGASTLKVVELGPTQGFVLGNENDEALPCADFHFPTSVLGARRFELVQSVANEVWLQVPNDARATVRWRENGHVLSEELLPRYGLLQESAVEERAPRSVRLPMGANGVVHIAGFSFLVQHSQRARLPRAARQGWLDGTVASYFAASLGAHAGFLGLLAFFVPPMGLTDGEDVERERVVLMRQYLESQAERERRQEQASQDAGGGRPRSDEPASGEAGKVGTLLPQPQTGKSARKMGPIVKNAVPPSRAEALEEARTFGTVSILTSAAFSGRTSPEFARSGGLGEADRDVMGGMFGATLDEQIGWGLAPLGIGESGGPGKGIDVGEIGPPGPWGPGDRRLPAFGSHRPKSPRVGTGPIDVSGRLAPEVIQRTVRQNYGRFRMCYERGLARNPNLEGRVAVRFAIDSAGRVLHASAGESSLPDSEVVACVVSAYFGLSFPEREQGIVTVVYPIAFSPE